MTSSVKIRILPKRRVSSLANVLVEEVAAEEAHYEEDVIDSNTLLLITTNNEILKTCEVVEGKDVGKDDNNTPVKKDKEIFTPSFKKWVEEEDVEDEEDDDGGVEEDTSNEAYERRHKKFELAEKKLKNREKERLQYERYQQQLAVEKLRNTDSKTLMSVASLRSNEPTNNDMIKLETIREKLLKEAEDQLARYDSLGLGGLGKGKNGGIGMKRKRSGNAIVGSGGDGGNGNVNCEVMNGGKVDDEAAKSKTKRLRTRKNNVVSGSFINPNLLVSTGSRKSARTCTTLIAFGIKIQTKKSKKQSPKKSFEPPSQIYGEMLSEYDKWRSNEYEDQIKANKEFNNSNI